MGQVACIIFVKAQLRWFVIYLYQSTKYCTALIYYDAWVSSFFLLTPFFPQTISPISTKLGVKNHWPKLVICCKNQWVTVYVGIIKGALDKYNIYLFISSSIEDLKSNQYQKFQLFLPMRFHFMRYFVNSIIFRVPHRLLYCVFIEVDFEK